ncbi:tetratricopeptide repeat protein [Dictyobacter arantiisoli]|uniref:HTH luxR-type domain-containing protein n=1 Tax=Dictyobacter arantiisoli TaxID=2014874 RepID=A0A5A5TAM2_9CHLR|nr:tetratricopeptide repeat protein [Dictyobacter arantiisoli]GCF08448.1 hypothetical protein KDI_20120 [Dictyobacter arantiisoli]
MARSTPTVRTNILSYREQDQEYHLAVDSADWYSWLMTATTFAFSSAAGSFTARKEQISNQRGGWYWKAYCRRQGKLLHAYLGKSETLSLERLQSVAAELTQQQVHLSTHGATTPIPGTVPGTLTGNIPALPTVLIGREQEIETACTLLHETTRLLTITGPGGVGKTRLALESAQILREDFLDGIFFVSLGPITDHALVVPTIAQELGFMEAGEEPLLARVKAYLHSKQILLVLDNFEQLMTASPLLADLLSSCPQLKLLVTSREVLHLRGEYELIVPPLALPDLQQLPDNETLLHYPAIALFTQRATAMKADFALTPTNAAIIAEICIQLDGLPLALELAAARIKHLPPQMLLTRLEHRLQVLTGGPRDLPTRQQTLRDALTWSYELLTTQEQKVFRALSVFIRGCTLEAAEELCATLFGTDVQALDVISSLIDKSLLQQAEQIDGSLRLRMLETIREYGEECLRTEGEDTQVRQAYAMYYLALVERAEPQLRKGEQALWLQRLEEDYDNLRGALGWLIEQPELPARAAALRFCGGLWRFWRIRNRHREGYQWAEKALRQSKQDQIEIPIRAKACFATATLADSQGHYQRSIELLQESLALYQAIDDQAGIVATLNRLGTAYARTTPVEAHALFEQSLQLARQQQDLYGIADALGTLGDEAFAQGFLSEARAFFEERLSIAQQLEDKRSSAYCLDSLGQIAANQGDYPRACELFQGSLTLHREVGDRVGIMLVLLPLAIVTLYQGDYATADFLLEECLIVSKELGNQHKVVHYLKKFNTNAPFYDQWQPLPTSLTTEGSSTIAYEAGDDEGMATRLFTLGCIEFTQGKFADAQQSLAESMDLFQQLDNRVMIAAVFSIQGHLAAHQGHYATAHSLMGESLTLTREMGDHWTLSSRLTQLGLVALNEGQNAQARTLIEESVRVAKKIGDPRYIAEALHLMGLLALYEGDYASAQRLLDESLAMQSEMRSGLTRAYLLADFGLLAIHQHDFKKASQLIEESLILCQRTGDRWFIPSCLERLGEVIVNQNAAARAVQLWGAATTLREEIGAPIPPIEDQLYQHSLASARQQLDITQFNAAWQAGREMSLEQILRFYDAKTASMPAQTPPSTDVVVNEKPLEKPPVLTGREKEVLQLLASGLPDTQIAAQLIISPRTVQTHLRTIYHKLEVSSRSAATRYALEHGLT